MTSNPYEGLPGYRFWRSGVAEASPLNMDGIYQRKWWIGNSDQIATAGSCFAQHIARFMRANAFNVLDCEPAPEGLPAAMHNSYGFGMYSARYGNLYTVRQLLQLADEAIGGTARTDIVWEKDGRFYDALRPAVEPRGHATPEAVIEHRQYHIEQVARMLRDMDVFVFTMGLTEAWEHRETGLVYPTAPGTIAGQFDPETYAFRNFQLYDIRRDFGDFIKQVTQYRGRSFRTILTVSPVPLTATGVDRHILQSSTYSKAVLRAAAGQLSDAQDRIDYFPSYEIVTNPAARGIFFASNLRSVTPEGVEVVMRVFFGQHRPGQTMALPDQPRAVAPVRGAPAPAEDVQCEEAMLEAFGT